MFNPNKYGHSMYEKVFYTNKLVIALGLSLSNNWLSESYICDISIVRMFQEKEPVVNVLKRNSFYQYSPIVAMYDGGFATDINFFDGLLRSKDFNSYVLNFDYSQYDYNFFRKEKIIYSQNLPCFLVGKIMGVY